MGTRYPHRTRLPARHGQPRPIRAPQTPGANPGNDTAAVTTSDIATALASSQKATSVARGQLIDKGLIYSPEYGRVAFTVPGMADYLTRQDPTITPGSDLRK